LILGPKDPGLCPRDKVLRTGLRTGGGADYRSSELTGGSEMMRLTINLKSSAEALGTEPETFVEFLKRERIRGILKLDDQWRVSIFTLAGLLNTSPGDLL